jgi:hypothetical protein
MGNEFAKPMATSKGVNAFSFEVEGPDFSYDVGCLYCGHPKDINTFDLSIYDVLRTFFFWNVCGGFRFEAQHRSFQVGVAVSAKNGKTLYATTTRSLQ